MVSSKRMQTLNNLKRTFTLTREALTYIFNSIQFNSIQFILHSSDPRVVLDPQDIEHVN
jgi:hypothetical protein